MAAAILIAKGPPTDDEIEAYFSLRQERYRMPAVISLAQVYVSVDSRGDRAARDAEEILAQLRRAEPEPSEIGRWGDPIMLPSVVFEQTEREIRATFGDDFADAVVVQPVGEWQGPVPSGYGLHLVTVTKRRESRIPEPEEVSSRIIGDMEYEARAAAREQLYQEIAQGYQIVLDRPVRELLDAAAL